ncbi:MAG: Wadjet anti-phage system protein JetA family protein [Undibacterium umbellatum]|uniref:Wadjet anti-phage system protein JetA family protein n=1 Tax=Undibacterium umbellatum TaxID=2762300 RepID=UPI003BB5EB31
MNLFDRIPITLFASLSGRNARRVWSLLVRLSESFFGPDSIPPHPEGYLHSQITKEIERFLLDEGWDNEDGHDESKLTSLATQSNQLLTRLVETGWLSEVKVGLTPFVSMRPTVAGLFDLLRSFVEEGPKLVSGDVLVIFNQLKSVVADPKGQAGGFVSAARICAQLINSLSHTSIRVRDLIEELTKEQDMPVFVRRFFTEHISQLYVRDFGALRTANHPLRLRHEILEMVSIVTQEDGLRTALLAGYSELGFAVGEEEQYLQRDIERLNRLSDVDKFLDKLDRVVDMANSRAISYLSYRLSASDRIEVVLEDTIKAVIEADAIGLELEGNLLGPGPIMSDERLRLPTIPSTPPKRVPLKKREMTLRERAICELRREMIAHRDTTPSAAKRYVQRYLKPGEERTAAQLPTQTIEDAISFIVLSRLAVIGSKKPKLLKQNPLLRNLDFGATLIEGKRIDTDYFSTADFKLRRSDKNATELD